MLMMRFGTYPEFKTFIKININVNFLAFTHLKTKKEIKNTVPA